MLHPRDTVAYISMPSNRKNERKAGRIDYPWNLKLHSNSSFIDIVSLCCFHLSSAAAQEFSYLRFLSRYPNNTFLGIVVPSDFWFITLGRDFWLWRIHPDDIKESLRNNFLYTHHLVNYSWGLRISAGVAVPLQSVKKKCLHSRKVSSAIVNSKVFGSRSSNTRKLPRREIQV